MRELLFRGKTTPNTSIDGGRSFGSTWVCGSLLTHEGFDEDEFCIRDHIRHIQAVVIPETVSQFTGITDRNGKKVFEGDIIELPDRYVEVTWSESNAQFDLTFVKYKNVKPIDFNGVYMRDLHKYEVVANIYDNPDFRLRMTGEESDTEKTAEWISHSRGNPTKEFHCSNCMGLTEIAHYAYNCYYKY